MDHVYDHLITQSIVMTVVAQYAYLKNTSPTMHIFLDYHRDITPHLQPWATSLDFSITDLSVLRSDKVGKCLWLAIVVVHSIRVSVVSVSMVIVVMSIILRSDVFHLIN